MVEAAAAISSRASSSLSPHVLRGFSVLEAEGVVVVVRVAFAWGLVVEGGLDDTLHRRRKRRRREEVKLWS